MFEQNPFGKNNGPFQSQEQQGEDLIELGTALLVDEAGKIKCYKVFVPLSVYQGIQTRILAGQGGITEFRDIQELTGSGPEDLNAFPYSLK